MFKTRSQKLEHIDIGDYTPEEYEGCIVELQRVNRWMGDTRALRHSVMRAIESEGVSHLTLLDVGAGSGELLRVLAEWATERGLTSQLVGLELNARSAREILQASPSSITAVRADALRLPFADNAFQYSICSLFTHHFSDEGVIAILRELERVSSRKLFVIDLHRHPVAYYFYTTIGRLFLHTRLLREDGALSILRSFKPHELRGLAERANLQNIHVRRRFPFRLVLSAGKPAGASASVGPTTQEYQAPEMVRKAS